MCDDIINVERLDKPLTARLEFSLPTLGLLLFGHDINVPACKHGSKPDILPPPTYRKGQLLIRDNHFYLSCILVQHDLCDLGRRKRIHNKRCRIR